MHVADPIPGAPTIDTRVALWRGAVRSTMKGNVAAGAEHFITAGPTPAQALSLVAAAVSELLQLVPVLTAMLTDSRSRTAEEHTSEQPQLEPDRSLSAVDAAAMLGVTTQWLYRHTRTLPFARKLSRKKTVYSEGGIRRWLAMRRPAA